MKAIILSAGQGKRLFPYTENTPKCLLPVAPGISLLGWQLDQLACAGIDEVVVVTGYQADRVEAEIARCRSFIAVRSLFNPDFDKADNLRSVWSARHEMDQDFILLNGDTLFTSDVVTQLIESPAQEITVTVSCKDRYDSDDMKVQLKDGLLDRIGKTLALDAVDAESIGMIRFLGAGVGDFRAAVETAIAAENGDRVWYLSVIDALARSLRIHIAEIASGDWCEVDFPVDLQRARTAVADWTVRAFPEEEAAQAS